MADNEPDLKPFGKYGGQSKRTYYAALAGKLWSDRATFDATYRELADFMLPHRVRFTPSDRNKGQRKDSKIIDSTARYSIRTLSSGLHAGLTSPARPWFKLGTADPDLAEFGPVKEWLHVVTQRMLQVFLQSNLYNALPLIYGDMGVFATCAMAMFDDTKDVFRCYPYPIGSYALGVDNRGVVCTFVRRFEMTVRALIMEYALQPNGDVDWSVLSRGVQNMYRRGQLEELIPVTTVVTPNMEHDPYKLHSKYLPFASCTFETDGDTGVFLREKGFKTFPILAPRWEVSAEGVYGDDSPGWMALGDVKGLQTMHKEKAKAIQKMVTPPIQGPVSLRNQKTSLIAGEITYVDVLDIRNQGVRAIHDVPLDIGDLTADISNNQYRIQRAFYEDLFLMLARSDDSRGAQPVTAREVEERHEEKLLALGPVLERTNDELLDPLIDRTFELMEKRGLVPDPPEELDGQNLKVEYISIMAKAQELVGVIGQDRLLTTVVQLSETFPTVRHKINIFEVVDEYARQLGVSPRLIRSNDEANADADKEAQMAAAAQASETAKNYGAALKSAGTTPMGGDTALDRIVPAAAGA